MHSLWNYCKPTSYQDWTPIYSHPLYSSRVFFSFDNFCFAFVFQLLTLTQSHEQNIYLIVATVEERERGGSVMGKVCALAVQTPHTKKPNSPWAAILCDDLAALLLNESLNWLASIELTLKHRVKCINQFFFKALFEFSSCWYLLLYWSYFFWNV